MLKSYNFNIIKEIEFPDHFKYSKKDIEKIILESKNFGCKIITTEKDFLRLTKKQQKNVNFLKVKLKIKKINGLKKSLNKIYEKN